MAFDDEVNYTVADFCDTVTFVAAGKLFSAHVTDNFIVFAYDIINILTLTHGKNW
jgi:uncharacterized membrane protein YoaK (UPF0700 family)